MNCNYATQIKKMLKDASYMETDYNNSAEQILNGVLVTSTSVSKTVVDYINMTGKITSQTDLPDTTMSTQTIYKNYCESTTTTMTDKASGVATTSQMVNPVYVDAYKNLFLPGGMLYPYNLDSIMFVSYSIKNKNCESYTLKPQVTKCITDYVSSNIEICKICANKYKITSTMNQVDASTNIPYKTIIECIISVQYSKCHNNSHRISEVEK